SAMAAVAPTTSRRWLRPALTAFGLTAAVALGVIIDRSLTPHAAALTFEKKSWDPMWVTNARFGPDGQTIIFSAAISGNVPELFAIRPGTITPQALGQKATHLLSVSSKGELAVLTGVRLLH